MPEFFAEHVPSNLDEFTTGYLEAVEWLLGEEMNRDKIRGFSRKAISNAKRDCRDFQSANAAQLATYEAESERSMSCAGMDFYLSRCRHGAGYFDRGNHPVFRELQQAARIYGSVDSQVWRGWIHLD